MAAYNDCLPAQGPYDIFIPSTLTRIQIIPMVMSRIPHAMHTINPESRPHFALAFRILAFK